MIDQLLTCTSTIQTSSSSFDVVTRAFPLWLANCHVLFQPLPRLFGPWVMDWNVGNHLRKARQGTAGPRAWGARWG